MLLIFLDSETTGLDSNKHRIIEIAFKIYDSKQKRILVSYSSVINQPAAVLAEADPRSMQINGFHEELILTGKSERAVAAEIIDDFNRSGVSNGSSVFICQNPSFDRIFFNQLISVEMQTEFKWPYHWLDLASMFWVKQKGEFLLEREISKNAIAEKLSLAREPDPHRAMNGVIHLMECYFALLDQEAPQLKAAEQSGQLG